MGTVRPLNESRRPTRKGEKEHVISKQEAQSTILYTKVKE
jgi:hypothetical protein